MVSFPKQRTLVEIEGIILEETYCNIAFGRLGGVLGAVNRISKTEGPNQKLDTKNS